MLFTFFFWFLLGSNSEGMLKKSIIFFYKAQFELSFRKPSKKKSFWYHKLLKFLKIRAVFKLILLSEKKKKIESYD